MQFEWDEEKNRSNLKKHGISFQDAVCVFKDPFRKEYYDVDHSINEDRYQVIGMVHKVLFVIYTEREEHLRIISARIATPNERRLYYDR